jgi:hypothetical protein
MQVYLVGGAVRDQLLGHPYHEKDYVVVGAMPEQLLAQGFQPVGKDFPVFYILKPKMNMRWPALNGNQGMVIMALSFIPTVPLP